MEKISTWENVWGGDAIYDIAQDMEEVYEDSVGKSAFLWKGFWLPDGTIPSDDLASRPEEFESCGYTDDFEEWGIENSKEAISSGCKMIADVEEFIINKWRNKKV